MVQRKVVDDAFLSHRKAKLIECKSSFLKLQPENQQIYFYFVTIVTTVAALLHLDSGRGRWQVVVTIILITLHNLS